MAGKPINEWPDNILVAALKQVDFSSFPEVRETILRELGRRAAVEYRRQTGKKVVALTVH